MAGNGVVFLNSQWVSPVSPVWEEYIHLAIRRQLQANTQIWAETDEPSGLVYLKRGRIRVDIVDIHGGNRTVMVLEPGNVVGESAVIDRAPIQVHVYSITHSELYFFPREIARTLAFRDHRVAAALLRSLNRKSRLLIKLLADLSYYPSAHRVGCTLHQLALQTGDRSPGGGLLLTGVCQQQVADLAGTSRTTVCQVVAELAVRGVIRRVGRRIEVVQPDALTSQCGLRRNCIWGQESRTEMASSRVETLAQPQEPRATELPAARRRQQPTCDTRP